jgi:hypothetical protein
LRTLQTKTGEEYQLYIHASNVHDVASKLYILSLLLSSKPFRVCD